MPDKKPKSTKWLLHAISIALLCFLAAIAQQLLGQPDATHILLTLLLCFVILRVVYELSLNPKKVPTVAASYFDQRKIVELLKADFEKRGIPYTIIDLGSGRGELTRRVARALPHATVIGIEREYFPHLRSVMWQKLLGLKNLSYRRDDFLQTDCSQASAMLVYLNGSIAQTVGEKLHKELKPGALIIANTFPLLGAWHPIEEITAPAPLWIKLLVYRR